jgi:hypothetical protein
MGEWVLRSVVAASLAVSPVHRFTRSPFRPTPIASNAQRQFDIQQYLI